MLRLGWITFHSHIPRLIGICVASLSLSARKRFQINPPPLLFRSSFLKKEIKDDTVGISSSFASSQLCRIVSCSIVAVYVAV
jgi:hypothetical protein